MLKTLGKGAVVVGLLSLTSGVTRGQAPGSGAGANWPTYGGDDASSRFSTLTDITPANVGTLTRAWTYHALPAAAAPPPAPAGADTPPPAAGGGGRGGRGGLTGGTRGSEATPIVVDDVMYMPTPYNRVIAIQADTGKELWVYQSPSAVTNRGVEYWPGDGTAPPMVLFVSGGFLVGLDARTGTPAPTFGDNGKVDFKQGITNGMTTGQLSMSSPPKVYKNIIITGVRVQESPAKGYAGDTRGWDARTGKLVWQFHSVPQPDEPNHDTWEAGWESRSGTNVWGFVSVDPELGLVFLPHGSPSGDFYGGDRNGANLYGNSLVALDAETGKLKWYFQTVHHDTWDFDLESAPILFEMNRNGVRTPAVALTSKTGLVFMLDRRTGKPLYGVEERPVPASPLPGDKGWPTEPWPVTPEPLSRMAFKYPDDIAKVTPEHEAFCRDLYTKNELHNEGPFTRYGLTTTIQFPGTLGASNWHGGSYNPSLGYLFYNTLDLADTGRMGESPVGSGIYTRNGFNRFWDGQKYWPCQAPPWGEMVAINVNTGKYAWRVPLGVIEELDAKGVHNTGTMNMGGSIATATGLVFIGATNDRRFRAFDARTGKVLWETQLETGAYATPITYRGRDGKQYVAVFATGGGYYDRQTGDSLIAFRLP